MQLVVPAEEIPQFLLGAELAQVGHKQGGARCIRHGVGGGGGGGGAGATHRTGEHGAGGGGQVERGRRLVQRGAGGGDHGQRVYLWKQPPPARTLLQHPRH